MVQYLPFIFIANFHAVHRTTMLSRSCNALQSLYNFCRINPFSAFTLNICASDVFVLILNWFHLKWKKKFFASEFVNRSRQKWVNIAAPYLHDPVTTVLVQQPAQVLLEDFVSFCNIFSCFNEFFKDLLEKKN